jgi:hypothetical protein
LVGPKGADDFRAGVNGSIMGVAVGSPRRPDLSRKRSRRVGSHRRDSHCWECGYHPAFDADSGTTRHSACLRCGSGRFGLDGRASSTGKPGRNRLSLRETRNWRMSFCLLASDPAAQPNPPG